MVKINQLFVIIVFSTTLFNLAYPQNAEMFCRNEVDVGGKNICLPEVDGMVECYLNPNVKSKADRFEFGANTILGFYITNDAYRNVDKFEELFLNEYIKIYVVDNLKNKDISYSEFQKVGEIIGNNFIEENWDKLKKEIEKNKEYLSVGKPVMIESYYPAEDINTFLMLGKIQGYDKEYIMLMTMNLILIKDRLIWLAYYQSYEGIQTIQNVKSKSDYIVLLFKDGNKKQ